VLSVRTAHDIVAASIREHLELAGSLSAEAGEVIVAASEAMVRCLENGGTVFWCGNGGSAADCQHMAAELVGRFKRERRALSSQALTTDSSALTAIGNDFGYAEVFSRQLEARGRKGDLLVAISTSGRSENVRRAASKAREMGITTFALLGGDGGPLRAECDLSLVVSSRETARIQEIHLMVEHILCDLVDQRFA
jgi:D-sedoheptulose 7-phosphate isomerase